MGVLAGSLRNIDHGPPVRQAFSAAVAHSRHRAGAPSGRDSGILAPCYGLPVISAAHKAQQEKPLHGGTNTLWGSQGLGLVLETLNSVTALLIYTEAEASFLSLPTPQASQTILGPAGTNLTADEVLLSNTLDAELPQSEAAR